MLAITRQPRLLVKMPVGQARIGLAIGASQFDLTIKPLFKSIGAGGGLGAAAAPQWHVVSANQPGAEVNAWDLCHHVIANGLGVATAGAVEFAEPDLEQQWIHVTDAQHAFALTRTCDAADPPDASLPAGSGFYWFRDSTHSQLEAARTDVGAPANRVMIAHCDTGYDPAHSTLPQHLRVDLQRNLVDSDFPNDATDRSAGLVNNLGHGTGTLSLLAGGVVGGTPLGGAAFLDILPIRVANSVILFRNSAIAQAFDLVHSLFATPNRVHVITMSMGGLASAAWADAVNALYDLGVFVVTAAGNNFGNLPTHNIVYPARFNRVVAACGVMANGAPYADLAVQTMAGNYGPAKKMKTAISGCTPNTPWARFGCPQIVDHDGQGTSAATPQVAAAAALWIQKYRAQWEAYSHGWMRVEAVRKALFETARLTSPGLESHLGRGMVQADSALALAPAAEAALQKLPDDSVSFPFLQVLTGLGAAPDTSPRHRMLELEALQLTQQSHELEQLLPDPDIDPALISPADRQRIIDALIAAPGASDTLRQALGAHSVATAPTAQVPVPQHLSPADKRRLQRAIDPPQRAPLKRRLRVFAFDPLLASKPDLVGLNSTALDVHWEKDLKPGPTGEYLQVVDVDPATGACYAPVDLNAPLPLAEDGLTPSETNPRFHQQMVYAVAMKTIQHFERALGRVALWSPRRITRDAHPDDIYVRRLRIYPHAIREANSFYSPDKKALLFGYFPASKSNPGDNLPGGTVFCCLSHDIVAHETTHALLDGLHRRFQEATNPDVLAFHEAFADIVALFQHFTVSEALHDQIARTQGDLARQNMLGELAQQFGQAIGNYGALRSAIGQVNEDEVWQPTKPTKDDYRNATEPHDRGAVLVAAVFSAFLDIYKRRSADLIRLATQGTGILPLGAIPADLVIRLSEEASKTAEQVLNMCIRALDYCPPVDITFGEYLRALITADREMVPDDAMAYRAAFIDAFRRRGIFPQGVRNLSSESLTWDNPEINIKLDRMFNKIKLDWDLSASREHAFDSSNSNGAIVHKWIEDTMTPAEVSSLGFYTSSMRADFERQNAGKLRSFEVHSVRPVRRVSPDGGQRLDIVIEITQSWIPDNGGGQRYRGGCTLIVDPSTRSIRYCIRKRVGSVERMATQQSFRMSMAASSLRGNYFDSDSSSAEPFAILHRGA